MIKVTKKLSIFTVLVLIICLLVGSVIAFAADNKVYKIRFAHGLPGTHNVAIQFANTREGSFTLIKNYFQQLRPVPVKWEHSIPITWEQLFLSLGYLKFLW